MPVPTITWKKGTIRIIDQTSLPSTLRFLNITDVETLCDAIRTLKVRGAPALGIAGAMGAALAAFAVPGEDADLLRRRVRQAISDLAVTRPTAVNLFLGLNRARKILESSEGMSADQIRRALEREALASFREDRDVCQRLGEYGAGLFAKNCSVITHCNAGGLATGGFGTALGVIETAFRQGKIAKVYSCETRPLLQGSRLTAWEMKQAKIPVTVLCDSAAGWLMRTGRIDAVVVGADRVARNGDTANKIGTYALAILARRHGIPLYIAAPLSSFDFSILSGRDIPVEYRSGDEVIRGFGSLTAPKGVDVFNPAFDVTPNALISAFITECGVVSKPYRQSFARLRQSVRQRSSNLEDNG
jgi:methylthioribose-1-phosphate isomerase